MYINDIVINNVYFTKMQIDPWHLCFSSLLAAPFWISAPRNLILAPNETGILTCRVSGEPMPTISWFVNGVPLTSEWKLHSGLRENLYKSMSLQPSLELKSLLDDYFSKILFIPFVVWSQMLPRIPVVRWKPTLWYSAVCSQDPVPSTSATHPMSSATC